MLVPRL